MSGTRVKGKVLTNVDELIQDANRQIAEAKDRIAVLRQAIKSFEQLRGIAQMNGQKS